MKIVVCIKQVPDTADVKWTEEHTMVREGVQSILNPFDEYAVETALRIRKNDPESTITVLTMGPTQAKDALKKALAMGADQAILLTDIKLAGADTLVTSRTLAHVIQKYIGVVDLIICGQFAIDANTAQVGPGIAEHLRLPQVTYVKQIESIAEGSIVVNREIEEGIQRIQMQLPGVICMMKCDYDPRKPSIRDFMKAYKALVLELSMENLGLEASEVGRKGSPTRVAKVSTPTARICCELIQATDLQVAVNTLLEKLKKAHILA